MEDNRVPTKNNNINRIIAYILIVVAIAGAILPILWIFEIIDLKRIAVIFAKGYKGSASNTPILYGILALCACYLLKQNNK